MRVSPHLNSENGVSCSDTMFKIINAKVIILSHLRKLIRESSVHICNCPDMLLRLSSQKTLLYEIVREKYSLYG